MPRLITYAVFKVLTLGLLTFGAAAHAQIFSGMTVDGANAGVGQPVKVVLNFDVMSGTNCGMNLQWGDGAVDDFKINQRKDVPWVTSHKYTKPGSYEIRAIPKTQGFALKCGGSEQLVKVTVAAPLAAPNTKTSAPSGARSSGVPKAVVSDPGAAPASCPEGWKLTAKGVNPKTRAFTCTAPPNTALPAQRPSCPGELTYFENAKKGELGCRL